MNNKIETLSQTRWNLGFLLTPCTHMNICEHRHKRTHIHAQTHAHTHMNTCIKKMESPKLSSKVRYWDERNRFRATLKLLSWITRLININSFDCAFIEKTIAAQQQKERFSAQSPSSS